MNLPGNISERQHEYGQVAMTDETSVNRIFLETEFRPMRSSFFPNHEGKLSPFWPTLITLLAQKFSYSTRVSEVLCSSPDADRYRITLDMPLAVTCLGSSLS